LGLPRAQGGEKRKKKRVSLRNDPSGKHGWVQQHAIKEEREKKKRAATHRGKDAFLQAWGREKKREVGTKTLILYFLFLFELVVEREKKGREQGDEACQLP